MDSLHVTEKGMQPNPYHGEKVRKKVFPIWEQFLSLGGESDFQEDLAGFLAQA
jgi:hypothetical protein